MSADLATRLAGRISADADVLRTFALKRSAVQQHSGDGRGLEEVRDVVAALERVPGALAGVVSQLERSLLDQVADLPGGDGPEPASRALSVVAALDAAARLLGLAEAPLRRAADAVRGLFLAREAGGIEGSLVGVDTTSCGWCGIVFDTHDALFDHLGGADGTSPCREGIAGTGG